jgi:hypothetical protein
MDECCGWFVEFPILSVRFVYDEDALFSYVEIFCIVSAGRESDKSTTAAGLPVKGSVAKESTMA